MRRRAASLALLIAPVAAPAAAEPFWPRRGWTWGRPGAPNSGWRYTANGAVDRGAPPCRSRAPPCPPGRSRGIGCGWKVVDYVPAGARMLRFGLHLTDPDQLVGARLAHQAQSGPVRAVDRSRALMLAAALRW